MQRAHVGGEAASQRRLPKFRVEDECRGEHFVAKFLAGLTTRLPSPREPADELRHTILESHGVDVQRAVQAHGVVSCRPAQTQRVRLEHLHASVQPFVRVSTIPQLGDEPEPLVCNLGAERDVVVLRSGASSPSATCRSDVRRRSCTGWRILVLERRLPLSDAPLCRTLLRHSHFLPSSSHLLGGFRLQVLGEPDTCADDSVFV